MLGMWPSFLTVIACITPIEGFVIILVRPLSLQWHQSLGSSYVPTHVWRRHRTRSTAQMMAGPNKGKSPAFFEDWSVLEAEIRAYLAERESGEPKNQDNEGKDAAGNAVLSFLSIDPSSIALENAGERVEWDGEADILAYSELTRYGYEYLIEPMMKAGGYAAISNRMGIDLNTRIMKDRAYYQRMNPPIAVKKRDTDGFLTLGRAREERLNAAGEIDRGKREKALFEKQAMMDGTKRQDILAVKQTEGARDMDGDLRRPPGLPGQPQKRTLWKSSAEAKENPPEPLLFSLPQRASTIAVVACCALAYGRGTTQALEQGLLSQDVANLAAPASLLLIGLNAASAYAGGSVAKSKGRSVPLWVFKGALAGIPSLLEVKELPSIESSVVLPSGDGESNP